MISFISAYALAYWNTNVPGTVWCFATIPSSSVVISQEKCNKFQFTALNNSQLGVSFYFMCLISKHLISDLTIIIYKHLCMKRGEKRER